MASPKTSSAQWLTGSAAVLRAVRALCAAQRTVVLEVSRSGRSGEMVFQAGEIVTVRAGRFLDHEAFDLLLMWADSTCKLRPHAGSGETPMATEELVDAGLAFVAQLDTVADVIGGPRSTIGVDREKLASPTLRLPPAVRSFISTIHVGMRLPDLVSQSAFALNDGLKIVHRLCQLGVLVVRDAAAAGPSMAAQMAVVDWLLSSAPAPLGTAVRSDGVPENTGGRQQLSRGDLSFDEQDRAFFAREVLLEGPDSTDRFEDLEDTDTRRKIDHEKHKL